MKFIIFGLFVLCIACKDSDGCTVGDMRCEENKVEICNADTEWDMFMDCDQLVIPDAGTAQCGEDTELDVFTCLF